MERSKLIAERYIECSDKGELSYTEELTVLDHLVKKFNLTSKSELARQRGVSPAAITNSIKRGNEMVVSLSGIELICN